VKRFKQLVFSKRSDPMEGILGSRIVQPPLAMRPSALRKAKSQDTHDRLPTESVLTAEGVHRFIRPGGTAQLDGTVTGGQSRSAAAGEASSKEPTPSPTAPQPGGSTQTKAVHENVSHRPTTSLPVPTGSAPITPTHGKGHAHDPLQDQLYLNIGTGEECEDPAEQLIVSESPSNVDMDVYETAYQEEINRITARKETSTPGHLPTLYMTRRVENVKSLRDTHLIVDSGRTRDELKANIKALAKKAQKGLEGRAESERLAGKEGMYTKVWGNFSHLKGKVDEARDILREEDREKERQKSVGGAANTSLSSTPVPREVSRSSTPVQGS
jgi:[calcium/calmodulin-dependent protein kinase] kinase